MARVKIIRNSSPLMFMKPSAVSYFRWNLGLLPQFPVCRLLRRRQNILPCPWRQCRLGMRLHLLSIADISFPISIHESNPFLRAYRHGAERAYELEWVLFTVSFSHLANSESPWRKAPAQHLALRHEPIGLSQLAPALPTTEFRSSLDSSSLSNHCKRKAYAKIST
jgi:hypothetical protein